MITMGPDPVAWATLLMGLIFLALAVVFGLLAWKGRWGWIALLGVGLVGLPFFAYAMLSARTVVVGDGPSVIALIEEVADDIGEAGDAVGEIGDDIGELGDEFGAAVSDVIADFEQSRVAEPRIELDDGGQGDAAQDDPIQDQESVTEATITDAPPSDADGSEAAAQKAPADGSPADAEPTLQQGPTVDAPDWLEGEVAEGQAVLTAGPFASRRAAENAAREGVRDWIVSQADRIGGDAEALNEALGAVAAETLDRVVVERHVERRETSVGDVYLVYTLAEIDDDDRSTLAKIAADWRRERLRAVGLRGVATVGGGLIALLAIAHVALRAGVNRPHTPSA